MVTRPASGERVANADSGYLATKRVPPQPPAMPGAERHVSDVHTNVSHV